MKRSVCARLLRVARRKRSISTTNCRLIARRLRNRALVSLRTHSHRATHSHTRKQHARDQHSSVRLNAVRIVLNKLERQRLKQRSNPLALVHTKQECNTKQNATQKQKASPRSSNPTFWHLR